jgi:hypothetical protein
MKFVADSPVLVRLYRRDSNAESIERFLAEDGNLRLREV